MSQTVAADIPLSLYLHFPWCVRKCPYCDFNSHALRENEIPEDAYIDALLRDLDWELDSAPEPRRIGSIFMGGGTPSLFSDAGLARLLDGLRTRLRFADDIEITLEANPGAVDAVHFRGYVEAGINRLSIGVQSLDNEILRRIGRIHDRDEAVRAVDTARRAGFANINLDLMFALPTQTPEGARRELGDALALAPEHISYYQLTLEPNTEFGARPPQRLPDDDTAWAMQETAQALLAEHGYAQYEVSAYARDGRHARHNLNYWQFGDYLGIGAGAHAKRSFRETDGTLHIQRRARHKLPRSYLAFAGSADAIQDEHLVAPADRPFEFAMNALRLNQGFAIADYDGRTALHWRSLAAAEIAARQGLLTIDAHHVRPTSLGQRHLNGLLRLFLPR